MSSDVDAKTIKLTQDSLGKLIKKPALTDKLLKRPPFRFLHDIITNVSLKNFDRFKLNRYFCSGY